MIKTHRKTITTTINARIRKRSANNPKKKKEKTNKNLDFLLYTQRNIALVLVLVLGSIQKKYIIYE